MFTWAARFQSILSLPQRYGVIGRAAMMGVLGGAMAVVIGALTVLQGLGPLSYVFLGAEGAALGIAVSLIAHLLNRVPSASMAHGTHDELTQITPLVRERRADAPASQWAARFQTITSLPQRHGFPERAAMMGVVGGMGALVIGILPAAHEALKPLGLVVYVFLPTLGGACGMVLYLIATGCTRLNALTMTFRVLSFSRAAKAHKTSR
jgi:hypothetical protein